MAEPSTVVAEPTPPVPAEATVSGRDRAGALGAAAGPGGEPATPRADASAALLSPRERETAVLLAQGLTNRQVAQALVVTEGTAANYVRRVLERLGLRNRAQVAAWAVEHGLARPDEPPTSAPADRR